MNYQRLVLAFVSIGTVSACMGNAQAATITHAYNLNNTLMDMYGGPSLVTNGGTLAANGYSFAANQGLDLTGAIGQHKYSILVDYKLSDTMSGNGYKKIIDLKNSIVDEGVYQANGKLTPYPNGSNESVTIGDNQTVRLVLTRNALSGMFSGYFNGMQQFSFDDTFTNYGSFTSNIIKFFQDDNITGGSEAAGGMVEKIVIFDDELSSLEVATLGNVNTLVPGAEVPEPFTIVGTLVGGTAALRMRKKLKATDKV